MPFNVKFFSYLPLEKLDVAKKHILKLNPEIIESNNYEYVVVLGGDGTMLAAMKKFYNQEVKLVAINLGNLGFLTDNKTTNIFNHEFGQYKLLEVQTGTNSYLAVNECLVYLENNPELIDVKINNKFFYQYRGSGFMVSTALGSTGLNRSINGPLLLDDSQYILHEYLPVKDANSTFLGQDFVMSTSHTFDFDFKTKTEQNIFIKVDGITYKSNNNKFKIKIVSSQATQKLLSLPERLNKISQKIIGSNHDSSNQN